MSWKSDKALERLIKTFQRIKNGIFEEDIKAIKTINETIEESEKMVAIDNVLFAKLLCHVLNSNLHHYGNMKNSLSAVQDVFKKPLDHHIEFLAYNLNNQELNNYLKSIDINLEFTETAEQLKNNEELLKSNQKEIIKKIKSNWSKSKVEKSFVNTINEFIRDTENYI